MNVSEKLTISVIMPAYNAAHLLPKVLSPLMRMQDDGEVLEIIVVDDHSTDSTIQVADQLGATVIQTIKNGGPGAARNLAATIAKGDIFWFVDSDVVASGGSAVKICTAFGEPGVDAIFGSYDSTPEGKPWFSRYKNLTHHFYHQKACRDSNTFWAGCGAVRADVFDELGGFDIETYRVPSIEDIELGDRIRRSGGRILLLPDIQAKHLKVWSLKNAIFTDIFRRALPWSRLIISRGSLVNDLNLGWSERIKAAVAGSLLLSILVLPFVPIFWPMTLTFLILALLLNSDLARFLYRNGGFWFALAGLSFHQLYYVYSATVFVWCLFEFHVLGVKDRLHVP